MPGWRRAGAEFAIVVLGVAVALAADGWREDRLDRVLEAEYRDRLAEELRDGRERVLEVDERFDQVRQAADELIGILESGAPPTDSIGFIAAAARAAWTGSDPYQIRYDATYEELLATGNLGIIRDASLRAALVAHFRFSSEFVGVFEGIPEDYHLRFLAITGHAPVWYVNGDLKLSTLDEQRLITELTQSDEVLRELRWLRAVLGVVDTYFERATRSLDEVTPLL